MRKKRSRLTKHLLMRKMRLMGAHSSRGMTAFITPAASTKNAIIPGKKRRIKLKKFTYAIQMRLDLEDVTLPPLPLSNYWTQVDLFQKKARKQK